MSEGFRVAVVGVARAERERLIAQLVRVDPGTAVNEEISNRRNTTTNATSQDLFSNSHLSAYSLVGLEAYAVYRQAPGFAVLLVCFDVSSDRSLEQARLVSIDLTRNVARKIILVGLVPENFYSNYYYQSTYYATAIAVARTISAYYFIEVRTDRGVKQLSDCILQLLQIHSSAPVPAPTRGLFADIAELVSKLFGQPSVTSTQPCQSPPNSSTLNVAEIAKETALEISSQCAKNAQEEYFWEPLCLHQLRPSYGHTCGFYRDTMYIIGGRDSSGLHSDVARFELHTRNWSTPLVYHWTKQPPQEGAWTDPLGANVRQLLRDDLHVSRAIEWHFAAQCSIENKLYLFGGMCPHWAASPDSQCTCTHCLSMLDVNTGLWHILWESAGSVGPSFPGMCYGASLSCYEGKLYLFGGFSRTLGPTQLLHVFDLTSKIWLGCQQDVPPVPPSRYHHSSFCYRERLFIYGGSSGPHAHLTDMWSLSMKDPSPEWVIHSTTGEGPEARHQGVGCLVNGHQFVLACSCEEETTFSMFLLDLDTLQWKRLLVTTASLDPRQFFSVVHVPRNNSLLVYGGIQATAPVGDVYCFVITKHLVFNVPVDIWLLIFCHLNPHDLISLSQTCKYFYHICTQDVVWKVTFPYLTSLLGSNLRSIFFQGCTMWANPMYKLAQRHSSSKTQVID
ncbi:hypothetical protein Pelo_1736 [Pelomyxa schiedti]|nr:hypothetical protein Pelo_1736 [Pelomyxa schiedti]